MRCADLVVVLWGQEREMEQVKYKIIESKGFSNHEKSPQEALEHLRAYLSTNGGWFYIDGAVTNIDHVSAEKLQQASTVTITNVIIGGTI